MRARMSADCNRLFAFPRQWCANIFDILARYGKNTSPGFAFFDLAYCPSDHRGVLVAALHEEPLGNVEDLLDRRLRVLIACYGTSILIITINKP